jgi:hypothetical protein
MMSDPRSAMFSLGRMPVVKARATTASFIHCSKRLLDKSLASIGVKNPHLASGGFENRDTAGGIGCD